MTDITSKHAVVSQPPYALFMLFTDMRNFSRMVPSAQGLSVQADFDTLTATAQGFNIGLKVDERCPYSRISMVDWGAPFAFHVDVNFDPVPDNPYKSDFSIRLQADLNFMMKMMLGGKIKDALDKLVDSLAAASEGRMPEGFDPSKMPDVDGVDFHGSSNPNDWTWRS